MKNVRSRQTSRPTKHTLSQYVIVLVISNKIYPYDATFSQGFDGSPCRLILLILLKVISSPYYACAKQMFTYLYLQTNIYSDTSFRIISFSRFVFVTSLHSKQNLSEEIQKRLRDIPADSITRLVFRHLARRIVYTEPDQTRGRVFHPISKPREVN